MVSFGCYFHGDGISFIIYNISFVMERCPMFENLAKKTLSEQIYEKLRYDITRQIIHSDEKIDISMLKQKWNISQTPIREALMKLEQEGARGILP
jgi:DNA-binding GntR family transcriptional regulator